MLLICFFGNLDLGLSAKAGKGLAGIELQCVFRPQMEIRLRYIPGTILCGRLWVALRIAGHFHCIFNDPCAPHMPAMTILAISRILSDQDLRLEPADGLNDIFHTLLIIVLIDGLLIGLGIIVIELSELWIMSHSHMPQTIQDLMVSIRL